MVKRKELKNRLVLVTEKKNTKYVMLLIGINVGSIHESNNLNGASHFNEHMVFKTNKHRSYKQLLEDFERLGAKVNAYTAYDRTVFWAKSLPESLNEIIDIYYEGITNFEYVESEFRKEKEVVLTEARMYMDDPKSFIDDLFISSLYKSTPLEKPIIGELKTLKRMKKGDLEKFKKENYVASNTVIGVVGKFDEKSLEKKILETFGKIRKGKKNKIPPIKIENKKRLIEKRIDAAQAYLYLGYRVPTYDSEDWCKIFFLKEILYGGMSSRLFQSLREEKGIGYSVGCNYIDLAKNSGCFYVYIDGFDAKRKDEAIDTILKEFKKLKENFVSDDELERRKKVALFKFYENVSKIEYIAEEIVDRELTNRKLNLFKKDKFIKKINKKHIIEAANKYLNDDFTLVIGYPKN